MRSPPPCAARWRTGESPRPSRPDARPPAPLRLADDRSRRRAGRPALRAPQPARWSTSRSSAPGSAGPSWRRSSGPSRPRSSPSPTCARRCSACRAWPGVGRSSSRDRRRASRCRPTSASSRRPCARAASTTPCRCYAGDLLAGFDDAASEAWTSWLGFERDRLRAAWRAAVLQRVAGGIDAERGVELTGRLLEADPLDEAALRVHLQALAQSGQAGRAPAGLPRVRRPPPRRTGPRPRRRAAGAARQPDRRRRRTANDARRARRRRPATTASSAARSNGGASPSCWRRTTAACSAWSGRAASARHASPAACWTSWRRTSATAPPSSPLEDATTAAELGSRLAREVGAELAGRGDPLEQAIASLRGLQLLLVLDNFEQLVAAAPLLETLSRAARGCSCW